MSERTKARKDANLQLIYTADLEIPKNRGLLFDPIFFSAIKKKFGDPETISKLAEESMKYYQGSNQ